MPAQGRKLSIRSKIKNKFSQRKIIGKKVGSAVKGAASSVYKMTSARKAALVKAVKASAQARRATAARSNANSGRKDMGVVNKAKTQVSKNSNTVSKAAGRASASVSKAVGRGRAAVAKAGVSRRANSARNNSNSGRKGMSLANQAKTQVSKNSNTVAKAAGRGRAAVRGAVTQARARFTKKSPAPNNSMKFAQAAPKAAPRPNQRRGPATATRNTAPRPNQRRGPNDPRKSR